MAISIYHFWGIISRCKLLLGLLFLRYFSVTSPLLLRYFPLLKREESEEKAKKKRKTNGKRTENYRKTIEKRYGKIG